MGDEEQVPPPRPAAASSQESQEKEREQQDVKRLQRLPPLEYDRMNRDQMLAFIQCYQQMPECREMSEAYPIDSLESIFAVYPTEDPEKARLMESLAESFESYLQQAWSSEGKKQPQQASYFLFHKRFSRLIAQGIYLPVHMDMIPALLFTLLEVDQMNSEGLETIVTAVGSKELHFHEVGKLHPNDKERLYIYLNQNASYFRSANAEFMKQETTEVWFRRAIEGMPQFIFCPTVSAALPLLPPPLSTPGEPKLVLELSRLEAMPALYFERCSPKHKDDFHRWLLLKDKFNIRDEAPGSLKLAACLIKLGSNDFNVAKPKMPRDEVARLYEKYVQERWSVPSKQLPEPQSVYLFEMKFQKADDLWIWFPPEVMQQVLLLVLSIEQFDQLFMSKRLVVRASINTRSQIKLEKKAILEFLEEDCKLSFYKRKYNAIFSQLTSEESFEIWFLKTRNKPKFIIKPRRKQGIIIKMRGIKSHLLKDETAPVLS